jgi:hypothetical protein
MKLSVRNRVASWIALVAICAIPVRSSAKGETFQKTVTLSEARTLRSIPFPAGTRLSLFQRTNHTAPDAYWQVQGAHLPEGEAVWGLFKDDFAFLGAQPCVTLTSDEKDVHDCSPATPESFRVEASLAKPAELAGIGMQAGAVVADFGVPAKTAGPEFAQLEGTLSGAHVFGTAALDGGTPFRWNKTNGLTAATLANPVEIDGRLIQGKVTFGGPGGKPLTFSLAQSATIAGLPCAGAKEGGDVELYPSGKVSACVLTEAAAVGKMLAAAGPTSLYANGNAAHITLAREQTVRKILFPIGTRLSLSESGAPLEAKLPEPSVVVVQGVRCASLEKAMTGMRQDLAFHSNGNLDWCLLDGDQVIQGVPVSGTLSPDAFGLVDVRYTKFDENGKLLEGCLSAPHRFPKGEKELPAKTVFTLNPNGTLK